MGKITVQDYKFQCPLIGKELKINDKVFNFGICGKCKYNTLGQIIDNTVYCNYGSSSGGGSGSSEQQSGGETTFGVLNDLTDVNINNPEDGQALVYSSNTNSWKNDTVSGGGGYSDNTPDDPDELWTDYNQDNP